MSLEEELTEALRGTYEAARARGYIATYFLQMLEDHGGQETARRQLAKKDAQAGLYRLWELNVLHESMEAVVLQPKFRPLFKSEEIAEVRNRLEVLGYYPPE